MMRRATLLPALQVVAAGLDRKPGDDCFVNLGLHKYGSLLLLLPAEELAVITLHTAIRDLMVGETYLPGR